MRNQKKVVKMTELEQALGKLKDSICGINGVNIVAGVIADASISISVLGTDYQLLTRSSADDQKLVDNSGYCDQYEKIIVVSDFTDEQDDVMCVGNLEELRKKVTRHELIHAFLGESGLRECSEWAENEEMVDWFANQSPKIYKVFEELGLL